jgi:hypothetical protein
MRKRLAHRPRNLHMRYAPQSFPRSHKDFHATHWSYRRQTIAFPKHAPGQSLLLVPWGYRLLRNAIAFAH